MSHGIKRIALATAIAFAFVIAPISAHPSIVKGTVAAVGPKKVQVKTGAEKQGETPAWYAVDAKTKIYRDTTVVSFEDAKIQNGERIVVTVDHEADGAVRTTEIRLAAK